MLDYNLNRLLTILDNYEISLDITLDELALLPDDLVDYLETLNDKTDIITVLIINIRDLKEKIEEHNQKEWDEEFFPMIFDTFIDKGRNR